MCLCMYTRVWVCACVLCMNVCMYARSLYLCVNYMGDMFVHVSMICMGDVRIVCVYVYVWMCALYG